MRRRLPGTYLNAPRARPIHAGMSDPRSKKFRETLWFAKGAKDDAAAHDAAASGDALAVDKADLLPIEDRYLDDGSVRPSLTNLFGLHTGRTEYIAPVRLAGTGTALETRTLIGELKRGRMRVLATLGASAVVVGTAIALLAQ